jgi:phospholipid transport system substrate-binding protein
VLVPHIDFRVSSNLVLGAHWKDASESQRKAFMKEFQGFLVRFYTGALASYVDSADIPVDIMTFSDDVATRGANQALVRSRVGQASGDPVQVDYRMYWRDSWKVVDVSVAGISMVQNYRSNFTSTVKQHGIDALIAQLQERNRALALN